MKPKHPLLHAFLLGATIHGIGLFTLVAQTIAKPAPTPKTGADISGILAPAEPPTRAQNPASPTKSSTTPATRGATEIEILSPLMDGVMDVPAATIVVKYTLGAKVDLRVNGRGVESTLIGRTETDTQNNTVTQTWYGVGLGNTESTITAVAQKDGVTGTEVAVKVKVRGTPKSLRLETLESRVPADGRSLLTLEGKLLDENGNVSKQDGNVTISSTAGEFAGVDQDRDQPGFQVPYKEGRFTAKLRATVDAQTVRIRATALNLEALVQAQFETNLRTPVTTGVLDVWLGARGTDYYRSFREFLPDRGGNATELSVRGQVFSTGRMGDWLFTGAYNSQHSLNKVCNNNAGLIISSNNQSCDEVYPVFGDTSKLDVQAPSQDSLFIKFERPTGIANSLPDQVMWGDYSTSEFATKAQQFSATSRQLHGAKVNYNLGANLQGSAFYGDNIQGFQRDTIAPDGTSGYYFFSRRLLVSGSEQIAIEVEQLNRPGTIVQIEQLTRGQDYDIDYDRGTILLRRPLLRTSIDERGEVLGRKIIATYQFQKSDPGNNIYGGRLQYNFSRELNQESWVGTSYVRENQGVRGFDLFGVDTQISLSPTTTISAEYAKSGNATTFDGRKVEGTAVRVEAQTKLAELLQGRVFYRAASGGFSNTATSSFVSGQTRYGAELSSRFSSDTNLRLQYERENNNGVAPQVLFPNLTDLITARTNPVPGSQLDNSLTTITAGIQQRLGPSTLDLDYVNRDRQDRVSAANGGNSSQIRSRLSFPLDKNLTFQALNETSISSQQDTFSPNRTSFGLDWGVYPGISVKLNQNFFSGGNLNNASFTSLDVDGNYKLAQNTAVIGRYSLNPYQSIGAVGLQQGIVLRPGLKLDLAYERIIGGSTGGLTTNATGTQFPQPFAPGQSTSSVGISGGNSYSVGLSYTDNPNYQANARYEFRDGVGGSTSGINAGITGKVSSDLTALVRYQQNSSANQVLSGSPLGNTVNLKVGMAYRNPDNDRWNALLSYQYRNNPALLPEDILTSIGSGSEDHTVAAEAIYAPDWQWEFYGKYAIKTGRNFLANNFTSSNTLSLGQLRATYRLGYSWDLVADGRVITQPNFGYTETGLALETGYYIDPNLRLSVGYGFGRVDDPTITGGSRVGNGAYVGLTVKINELFNGFGLQKTTPPQQSESRLSKKDLN
jgi:hypothetical protein